MKVLSKKSILTLNFGVNEQFFWLFSRYLFFHYIFKKFITHLYYYSFLTEGYDNFVYFSLIINFSIKLRRQI
jgi:hypothetical protein